MRAGGEGGLGHEYARNGCTQEAPKDPRDDLVDIVNLPFHFLWFKLKVSFIKKVSSQLYFRQDQLQHSDVNHLNVTGRSTTVMHKV